MNAGSMVDANVLQADEAREVDGARRAEFAKGWRPLVACCVGIALGMSPHTAYTMGIVAGLLSKQFGWSRGAILGATMAGTIVVILLAPALGRLVDRIGARRVAIASTVGISLSLLLLAATPSWIAGFYALWALMCVLGLGTLPMTYTKIITQWFDRSRGLALGLTLASTGIAGAAYPFYIDWFASATNWRGAFVGLALLPLLISLPIQIFWLREPGEAITPKSDPVVSGVTARQARRDYRFWVSALAAMLLNAASGGLLTNFLPLLTESGLSHDGAIRALSVLALSITIGRLVCGFLLDRLWAPLAALVLVIPAALGALALTSHPIAPAVALCSVALIGLVTGAEFDLMSFITGRYFGRRHYSEIYGMQFAIFAIGSGMAPGIFGTMHDRLGSYSALLYFAAIMFVSAAVLLFTLGRYPKEYAPERER